MNFLGHLHLGLCMKTKPAGSWLCHGFEFHSQYIQVALSCSIFKVDSDVELSSRVPFICYPRQIGFQQRYTNCDTTHLRNYEDWWDNLQEFRFLHIWSESMQWVQQCFWYMKYHAASRAKVCVSTNICSSNRLFMIVYSFFLVTDNNFAQLSRPFSFLAVAHLCTRIPHNPSPAPTCRCHRPLPCHPQRTRHLLVDFKKIGG